MDKNENCSACKIKLDKDNYKRDRTVYKDCYNKKRRKNNNHTIIQIQQPKIQNVNKNNNNRTLVIGVSNCSKSYLMNYFLLQIQEPFFPITKSVNHYPKIKTQISDEVLPLENYKNSTIVFDDMLLSKQKGNNYLFFKR